MYIDLSLSQFYFRTYF